jgi:hypothetical protein
MLLIANLDPKLSTYEYTFYNELIQIGLHRVQLTQPLLHLVLESSGELYPLVVRVLYPLEKNTM